MKIDRSAAFSAIAACTLFFMTACEKHDGTYYYKSKCVAELNGRTYVDQTPVKNAFSPESTATPQLAYDGNSLFFYTELARDRGGEPAYIVEIQLFTDDSEGLPYRERTIEKADIEYSDPRLMTWEYIQYCKANKVSFALINHEAADKGTFRITSCDKEKGRYDGTFALTFSEGTLTGSFSI